MIIKKNILFLLFLCCLSACKKQKIDVSVKNTKNYEKEQQLQEAIARLSDIADTPLNAIVSAIEYDSQDPEQFKMICKASFDERYDIAQSYKAEMERLGWGLHAQFDTAHELMLVFEKPGKKFCLLSFEKAAVSIIMMKKKSLG